MLHVTEEKTWPLTEVNGRKGFLWPTPKIWDKGFLLLVVVAMNTSTRTYHLAY